MRGYKIGEASRILGVHPNTLRKWEKEGKIKAVRIGRDRVFLEEEIMKLLGKERDNAAAIYLFAGGKTPPVREGMRARRCVSTLKLNNRKYKLQL